ncbi:MAG: D-alanyl-D-alanine carboxypeptidase [Oscillospiraceae bacterium]|nr:D-alanyl-D-alanine carboxypeptidase [Oscillospiraceae bacterium]
MKRTARIAAAGLLAAAVLLLSALAAPSVSAKSALLLDADTGEILFEKNASSRSLIASTTKIMTALLIAEHCDADAQVVIEPEAVGVEGSSMYLREGDIFTVRQLLYGLMLQSGNDAAAALAQYLDGDEETFVRRMNERAAALGLADTHYANPHGLDSGENYSTAADLARLTAFALENDTFRGIVSTKTVSFGDRTLVNHNKLLWKYDGCIGVKTGYTRAAGRILVSAAEREGRRLIAVTICDGDDWNDHIKLLDYGFGNSQGRALPVRIHKENV